MDKVDRFGHLAQVGRTVLKNVDLEISMAGEDHGPVVGRVEPFVRVDGDAVGHLHAVHPIPEGLGAGREPAERGINMQPEVIFVAQRGG